MENASRYSRIGCASGHGGMKREPGDTATRRHSPRLNLPLRFHLSRTNLIRNTAWASIDLGNLQVNVRTLLSQDDSEWKPHRPAKHASRGQNAGSN